MQIFLFFLPSLWKNIEILRYFIQFNLEETKDAIYHLIYLVRKLELMKQKFSVSYYVLRLYTVGDNESF